jgi:hypothetical protein
LVYIPIGHGNAVEEVAMVPTGPQAQGDGEDRMEFWKNQVLELKNEAARWRSRAEELEQEKREMEDPVRCRFRSDDGVRVSERDVYKVGSRSWDVAVEARPNLAKWGRVEIGYLTLALSPCDLSADLTCEPQHSLDSSS